MSAKRDIDKITKRLFFAIKRALNKNELTGIATLAINLINKRTRAGFGVKQAGGPATNLKSLSESYKKFRSKSKRLNTALTSPGKSNLTFTGQLLKSLTIREVDVANQKIFINANRRRRKGGVTNEDIAGFVSEQGREFLNLSRSELLKVQSAYRNNLISNIRRELN